MNIKDVAADAGVARSTVSYVLSGKKNLSASTKERVLASVAHAARLAVQQESQSFGAAEWVQEYHPARPADYPYVSEVRNELRDVDFFAVFTGQVEAVVASMAAQAPHSKR